MSADIGVIGLAVMGQNLVLNMADHGIQVRVYNRTVAKVDQFLEGPAKGLPLITGAHSLAELVAELQRPRRILLMVRAGQVVDDFITQLLPHLEPGDILIDGGNSLFSDSSRRVQSLAEQGILYIGAGISGGEEGARYGPAIMPGGNAAAWPHVQEILQTIAAKAEGEPCCQWVGEQGAGHYVKMVHNGIEYGDMQLIAEAYQLLREGLGLPVETLKEIFSEWNKGVLDSYLIEITARILEIKDEDGGPLLDKILDAAGQKGTGKWTGINALDLGIPLSLIAESVFARCLSALKEERRQAAETLVGPEVPFQGETQAYIGYIHDALYAAKIVSYAQGFMLLRQAGKDYGWQLDYAAIASLWRGGCIIRSRFLNDIRNAYRNDAELPNLLLNDFFREAISQALPGWRKSVILGVELGIPTPCLASALSFYDGYRSARLPANLLQAQRDYFGAHRYERVDRPRGEFFHTDWTGQGGAAGSSVYEV